MRSVGPVLAACALLGCGSVGGGGEEPTLAAGADESGVLQSGADLYLQYCARCHGATAEGGGPDAATQHPPPSDLTRLAPRWGTPLDKDRLADFLDGRNADPAHVVVWGEELYRGEREESVPREAARRGTILLILEYLETRQQPPLGG